MSDFFTFRKQYREKRQHLLLVFFIMILLSATYIFSLLAIPVSLSDSRLVTIPEGYSFKKSTELLEEQGIIRSSLLFQIINKIDPISVKAGTYLFEDYQYVFAVKRRLELGDYGDVYVRITIPEGSSNKEISNILSRKLTFFDEEIFKILTKDKEGYLFPDTYEVFPETTTEEIVTMMLQEFEVKLEPFLEDVSNSPRSLDQIVTMASLLEKESSDNPTEQKIVSGILWKRLDKGMPLQVDAPFLYIQGKTSQQLSLDDLRKDGLYNTYTRTGLTPTPIGNPGINTILAALHPESSLYFYYLHDTNGDIHYGVSHDDHVRNKQRYL